MSRNRTQSRDRGILLGVETLHQRQLLSAGMMSGLPAAPHGRFLVARTPAEVAQAVLESSGRISTPESRQRQTLIAPGAVRSDPTNQPTRSVPLATRRTGSAGNLDTAHGAIATINWGSRLSRVPRLHLKVIAAVPGHRAAMGRGVHPHRTSLTIVTEPAAPTVPGVAQSSGLTGQEQADHNPGHRRSDQPDSVAGATSAAPCKSRPYASGTAAF